MGRLTGRVAIVTGAASPRGLGFATARVLAREGAKVVVTDIDETTVSARAQELVDGGADVRAFGHDVTQEDEWKQIMARTLQAYGKLDILVNNAGITLSNTVESVPLKDWERVIAVNLSGTFLGCKHAVVTMQSQATGGAIVNIASIAGLVGFENSASYVASKGGVRLLSKVVALENAKKDIRCNSVYPGMIATDIHQPIIRDLPEHHAAILASIPMGRWGEPEDVANCVLFLASDESRYVTGAEFVIDGGITAK